IGVGIGEHILDLRAVGGFGLLDPAGLGGNALQSGHDLNLFLRLGKSAWTAARQTISRLLRQDVATIRDNAKMREKVLVRQADVVLKAPVTIGNYTDFYSSREHATNVGVMLRGPQNA